jgi:hypothetical protein
MTDNVIVNIKEKILTTLKQRFEYKRECKKKQSVKF